MTLEAQRVSSNQLRHIGAATVLLDVGGLRIVTDPVLDQAGSSYSLGRSRLAGELRYTNLLGPANPEALPEVADVVLLSHDHHRDNLDRAGLELARRARLVLTTVSGARRLRAKGLGNVHGLATWSTYEAGGVIFTGTPARHARLGANWLAGDVTGFVIQSASLSRPVYVTGDTLWYRGTREVAARFSVGTLLAHVGAGRFGGPLLRRWLRFSMNAREAVAMASAFPSAQLVPIHYEGWSHFSEGRRELEAAFAQAGCEAQLRFVPRGEAVDLEVPLGPRVRAIVSPPTPIG
jgi:L-ascorbate metabolism protein UlaG (beta-lactamase superfamily)